MKLGKYKLMLLVTIICILTSGKAQYNKYAGDTTVSKRYLDSVKNQLAIYTVTSYTHLNLYDRSQEELRKLAMKYQIGQDQFTNLMKRRRRENINYGICFIFLMSLSFISITQFNK